MSMDQASHGLITAVEALLAMMEKDDRDKEFIPVTTEEANRGALFAGHYGDRLPEVTRVYNALTLFKAYREALKKGPRLDEHHIRYPGGMRDQ